MFSHSRIFNAFNQDVTADILMTTVGIDALILNVGTILGNADIAKTMVDQLLKTLPTCITQNTIAELDTLNREWQTKWQSEKYPLVWQEIRRYLNSNEIQFAGRLEEKNYLFGGIRYLKPGYLLTAINQYIDQMSVKTQSPNEGFSSTKYSTANLYRFLTTLLMLQTFNTFSAVSAASRQKTCRADLYPLTSDRSPLKYVWNQQCIAKPMTKAFMKKKKAKALEKSFLTYSQVPIEYAQVLVFGATHGSNGEPHPNHKLISKHINRITKTGEHFLLEGLGRNVISECSQLMKLYNIVVPTLSGLTCRGWEIPEHHASAILSANNFNLQKDIYLTDYKEKSSVLRKKVENLTLSLKTLQESEQQFQLERSILLRDTSQLRAEASHLDIRKTLGLYLSEFINLFDFFDLLDSMSEKAERINNNSDKLNMKSNDLQITMKQLSDRMNDLELQLKQTEPEQNKLDLDVKLKTDTLQKESEIFANLALSPRNVGIELTSDETLLAAPTKRLYIQGGSLHFFTNKTMSSYTNQDHIYRLRRYFDYLETKGISVAFLYPRSDDDAKEYKNAFKLKK